MGVFRPVAIGHFTAYDYTCFAVPGNTSPPLVGFEPDKDSPMKRIILLVAVVLTGTTLTGVAGEISFIEDFALAKDRTLALEQLIPGTEDFYYYHCLHYQNSEQYERVDQLLQAWIKRYNYTPRVREIQHRQALLTYPLHPNDTLAYLQRTLNLRFDHQRETPDARPQLPTRLDEALIGRDRLMAEAYRKYKNLDGFDDPALDWLLDANVPEDRRRTLLSRLTRPDHPQLVKVVLDDLNFTGQWWFRLIADPRQPFTCPVGRVPGVEARPSEQLGIHQHVSVQAAPR